MKKTKYPLALERKAELWIGLFVILATATIAFSCKTAQHGIVESQVTKLSVYSMSLEKDMRVNVYVPANYDSRKKYPVLYMLHGYTDNEDCWMPNLGLKETADRLIAEGRINPLIIVMPQIDNSFGVNSDKIINMSMSFSAGSYEDWLYKDLVPYVDAHFGTIKNKSGRYVGGLSMGGFAALRLAFIHDDMFGKVGGHSPAFIEDSWLYPNDEMRKDRDPIIIAGNKDLGKLKVYLDCGDRDGFKFYIGCEKLAEVLSRRGIACEYHLNPGEHTKEYWIDNSEAYLLFYSGKN